jgi:hypothetical protein
VEAGQQVSNMARRVRWALGAFVLCAGVYGQSVAQSATVAPPKDKTPAEWQALARADLDAAHAAVIAGHPGYIDQQNPTFRDWTERGYREALALVPRVDGYEGLLSAVRYYVAGFRDGHFGYSDDVRSNDYHVMSSGWLLDKVGDDYVVVGHNPEWQGPLPPLDAKLLDCDGRTPQALIAEDVAPYVDQRKLPGMQGGLAGMLGYPALAGIGLETCDFELAGGKRLTYAVGYRSVSSASMFKTRARPVAHVDWRNAYTFQDGVLWILAQNFSPNPQQVKDLDAMLKEIAALQGVRTIVFDTRGNGGGSSDVGDQILQAATGGLSYDTRDVGSLPRTYAQWRVSDIGLQALDDYVRIMRERYGADHERTREMEARRDQMRQASQAGQPWVEQDDGPRVTRAYVAQHNGYLRGHQHRFDGTVAVIADNTCASACLDFLDAIRLIPTSIQLGQTTSSDTLYLEAGGRVRMPSGNMLILPLKVWRNRARGDSEPLVPDVPLQVDMRDDAAVRAATLAALARPTVAASAANR